MALTAGVANSYKQEVLQGIHAASDSYKIALYPSTATYSPATTGYSAAGEVIGAGYTAGGNTLTGFSVSGTGATARLDFASTSWANATITARGAVIYNSSKANKIVAVLDFGADVSSTAGTFTVNMPSVGDATSLIRIA